MLTVYKSDLKAELVFRKNELRTLLEERVQQQERGSYNPFKRRASKDLNENIIQCRKEIRRIQKNLENPLY